MHKKQKKKQSEGKTKIVLADLSHMFNDSCSKVEESSFQ